MKYIRTFLAFGFILLAQDASAQIKWRVQQLHVDNNESVAIGDIDGDGKTDISAGESWYRAPEFEALPLRHIEPFGKDYLQNNGEHLFDVDGDGDLDVISGGFTLPIVSWFENPGEGNYAGETWKVHKLVNTGTSQNEATFLHDLDGDGTPEFIENSWNKKNPMQIFRLQRSAAKLSLKHHIVAEKGNGQGIGFGDIDGDSKTDIVFQNGWYQQPPGGAFSGSWQYHHDFDLPHASCPILVVDLNGDRRNDLIWGDGHNYGLYWQEQLAPQAGATTWRQHLIDKKFSQAHALAWEDIDNDGQPELITGKRYYAHSGKDVGAQDEITLQYYDWNPQGSSWKKRLISSAAAGKGPGTGLQIRVEDLDGNGWKDVIVSGKSGTHILWNLGN